MAFTIYKPEWGAGRPIRGVLFDMDGIVLDTEKLYTRFWMEACHFYGYPMTREQALGMRSLGKGFGQAKLDSYFCGGVDYARIRDKRVELMEAFIRDHGVETKPGIDKLLNHLKERGIPAAITSSSPPERILRYLTPLGLDRRFQRLCSGYEVANSKPAPDIYLYGAAQLGLEAEDCLALEDSPAGILSAARAGCRTVMIPDQDEPTPETEALLWAKADTLADIIGLIG